VPCSETLVFLVAFLALRFSPPSRSNLFTWRRDLLCCRREKILPSFLS
jgi:hypothetical protein